MRGAGLGIEVIRAVGGGAKSDLWLQMKADVTGLPVERPAVTEAATAGAALLAATGAGAFGSLEEAVASFFRTERVFTPDAQQAEAYEPAYQAYLETSRRVYRSGSQQQA